MLVWWAGAVPLKNFLHTCWYPFTFGVKDVVIEPDPVLFLESIKKGKLASVANMAVLINKK